MVDQVQDVIQMQDLNWGALDHASHAPQFNY